MKKFLTFLVAIVLLANLNTNAQNISQIDYSTPLHVGSNTGTLTIPDDIAVVTPGDKGIGKGFTLPTEVGKAYKFSYSSTSTSPIFYTEMYVVTN